jgi:methyl-accepting chemotaxis protein
MKHISKLKNDHVTFKDTNFAKLNSKVSWSVTKSTECGLGKWIALQESHGHKMTQSSEWNHLKNVHNQVHSNVQSYIDSSANNTDNKALSKIGHDIEDSTHAVFSALDTIKTVKCKHEETNTNSAPTRMVEQNEPTQKPRTIASSSPRPVMNRNEAPKAKLREVVVASSDDDDEWESF